MKHKIIIGLLGALVGISITGLFLDNSSDFKKEPNKNSPAQVTLNLNQAQKENQNINLPKPKQELLTVLMLGDLMLDRYVYSSIKKNGLEHSFVNIKDFLKESDLTQVNLEGCFTDFAPKALDPNNLVFTLDPTLVPVLSNLGFDLVSLANNHSFNFGQTGLAQCQQYLADNNLDFFGHPLNTENISQVIEVEDQRIGFVGYSELGTANFDQVIDEVEKTAPHVDFLIVFPHWGNEYQEIFSQSQQNKAHQLIGAGADAIIGSHPHVIQPVEVYQNKAIFYSLGNFLFDQTFSQATMQGLAVKLRISDSKIDYYLYPLDISRAMQTSLMEQQKGDIILKELANNSLADKNIKEQILQGKITFNR